MQRLLDDQIDIPGLGHLADTGVVLEVCPTSNIATRAVDRIEDHPLRAFVEAGVTVTIGQTEVTLATTHEAAVELLEASNHVGPSGSLKAVTRSGARLTLNAAITAAARTALRGRFAAGTEAEHDLHEAIDDLLESWGE